MKPFTIAILKYSIPLALIFVLQWWILYYSPLNVPEYIPYTPIKLHGSLLTVYMITGLILFQKQLIKSHTPISIGKLTLLGCLMIGITEALFQLVRVPIEKVDLFHFLKAVLVIGAFGLVYSFLIAFQLKTRCTDQLFLIIVAIIVSFNVILHFYPNIK